MEQHFEVSSFLSTEAEVLDRHRYADWLALLTDDVRYLMPVRVTTARDTHAEVLGGMAHFDEDRYSLEKRVQRLLTEYAWTEDPQSRTRRFVSNVRVTDLGSDEFLAQSYLLMFRSRGDVQPPDFVSAERTDRIRRVDGALRLARREIVVDEAVLRTQNLALFL
jgi:3-phenylpropionate/cinnamic acid dioxygenase small subunit